MTRRTRKEASEHPLVSKKVTEFDDSNLAHPIDERGLTAEEEAEQLRKSRAEAAPGETVSVAEATADVAQDSAEGGN